jgi:hypothetical protein
LKTKITILVLEISDTPRINGITPLKILIDKDRKPISSYISTKSEKDTISEILSKYSNLDIRYCYPALSDFFHEPGSPECEVVYVVKVTEHFVYPSPDAILENLENINIEDKYVRSIQSTPRSTSQ